MELEIVPLIEDNELREVLDRQEARTEREKHSHAGDDGD